MTERRYNYENSSDSQSFEAVIADEKMWLGKGYWDNTTQYFKGTNDEVLYLFGIQSSVYQNKINYTVNHWGLVATERRSY